MRGARGSARRSRSRSRPLARAGARSLAWLPVSLRSAGAAAGAARCRSRDIVRVGWPSLLERVLYHAGFSRYVAIIGRLGDAVMAANQALISVESICFMSADGFGIAAAALVAQKLGAKDASMMPAGHAHRRSRRGARLTRSASSCSRCGAASCPSSPRTRGHRVGLSAVPVLALAQPFMATAMVLAQALRGAGRTRTALLISLVGAVVRAALVHVALRDRARPGPARRVARLDLRLDRARRADARGKPPHRQR